MIDLLPELRSTSNESRGSPRGLSIRRVRIGHTPYTAARRGERLRGPVVAQAAVRPDPVVLIPQLPLARFHVTVLANSPKPRPPVRSRGPSTTRSEPPRRSRRRYCNRGCLLVNRWSVGTKAASLPRVRRQYRTVDWFRLDDAMEIHCGPVRRWEYHKSHRMNDLRIGLWDSALCSGGLLSAAKLSRNSHCCRTNFRGRVKASRAPNLSAEMSMSEKM